MSMKILRLPKSRVLLVDVGHWCLEAQVALHSPRTLVSVDARLGGDGIPAGIHTNVCLLGLFMEFNVYDTRGGDDLDWEE